MAPTWFIVAVLSSSLSVASAQSELSVQPAAETVTKTPDDSAPLASAEKIQLTDAVVNRIESEKATADIADLFAFDTEETLSKRATSECKTYPSDALWPKDWVWDIFNLLLGDALIPTVPIAAACYNSEWGQKDQAKCDAIVSAFTRSSTHENHPTSNMWPIYQGRTCMAKNITLSTDTCILGGYPAYSVNISSVAQIQLALNFAQNLNLRLVIKNTGHDYLGKSSGAGSLELWMHNLKEIEYLPSYKSRSYEGKAFKVGAGVTVQEIYRAAAAQGTTVQGGICESVGYVGGYLQGGGHNPLNHYYGMAADSVLVYQVVTANGRFVTASETSHPDLFWALRGGGAGTYGVVTSAIVQAHPDMSALHTNFILGNKTDGSQTVSTESFYEMLRFFWEHFPTYTDAGTYSFFLVFNTSGQLTMRMSSWFAPGHTKESFANLSKPFFDKVDELGIPYQTPKNTTYYDSFFPAYWDAWGKNNFPLGVATSLPGNRLIPKSHWTDRAKLETTWKQVRDHIGSARHFVAYFQAPQNPQKVDNAVSSAWRNAQVFLVTSSPKFAENATTAEIAAANKYLHEVNLQPWRDITPAGEGGGSYLNEASVDEPKWQEDFYGDQYERLVGIKKRYDPRGLFYATTAVGSDEWEIRNPEAGYTTQNGKLCRV